METDTGALSLAESQLLSLSQQPFSQTLSGLRVNCNIKYGAQWRCHLLVVLVEVATRRNILCGGECGRRMLSSMKKCIVGRKDEVSWLANSFFSCAVSLGTLRRCFWRRRIERLRTLVQMTKRRRKHPNIECSTLLALSTAGRCSKCLLEKSLHVFGHLINSTTRETVEVESRRQDTWCGIEGANGWRKLVAIEAAIWKPRKVFKL